MELQRTKAGFEDSPEQRFRVAVLARLWCYVKMFECDDATTFFVEHRRLIGDVLMLAGRLPNPVSHDRAAVRRIVRNLLRQVQSESLNIEYKTLLGIVYASAHEVEIGN